MKKIQDYNIILLVSLYINKGYFIMRKIKNELCNNRRLLSVVLAIIDVAFIALLLIGLCIGIFGKHTYNFSIEYGEEHSNKNYAQMYYAPSVKKMTEEDSINAYFENKKANFKIKMGLAEINNNLFRVDPINTLEVYSIKSITLSDFWGNSIEVSGSKLEKYISSRKDVEYEVHDDGLYITALTQDNMFILSQKLNYKVVKLFLNRQLVLFYIGTFCYLLFGILQFVLLCQNNDDKKHSRIFNFLSAFITYILTALGGALLYGFWYMQKNFKDVPIGQIIYHLNTPLEGTNTSSFSVIFISIILIIIICVLMVTFGLLIFRKKKNKWIYKFWMSLLGCIAIGYSIILCCFHFDIISYLKYTKQDSTIYEDNYVDGRDVAITFPKEKRNLIYIFLESMEMTYSDQSVGGAMSENYIPELTQISLENENFGIYGKLNGAYTTSGATFTMGGLVAQTSGVPINENLISNDTLNSKWESDNNYVPGVWAIGDVLKGEGYNQEFLIGSDKKFAGRSSYFHGHGNYDIFDYYTAIDRGYIDDDYMVWWGYEDEKLFEYAKNELNNLASKGEPFNLTMLTVDTHFTDGYVCELCQNQYDEQYSNVIACSSRQVSEFLDWIKQQDFYDNTTVVISGDHLTMDSDYIERQNATDFNRRTYFTIVNGAAVNEKPCVEREYTTLDLYPTTLAALGVQIEGNRLGLGTNLYSGEDTLIEKYGLDYINVELLKDSQLYRKKLLYGKN